jgi:hypothetical protein
LANLDFHLIEKVPHFLHRDFVLHGDLLGHGAGNLTFPSGLLELGNNLIFLQGRILLSSEMNKTLGSSFNPGKTITHKKEPGKDKKGESRLPSALPLLREVE